MESLSVKLGVILVGLAIFGYTEVWGGDELGRPSLRGLREIFVVTENLSDEAVKDGLSKDQIQTDVGLKLRMAGIKVISKEESSLTSGYPFLFVTVNAMRHRSGLFAIGIRVSLEQDVYLVRNPKVSLSTSTWSVEGVYIVGETNIMQVREKIKDLVDDFINDYLAENPK